jgi:23S rRNA pseudouridine1911/1915/1917 synthase
MQKFEIQLKQAGLRIDQAISDFLPDLSRSQIKRWIESGDIVVDQRRIQPKTRVAGGEIVLINRAVYEPAIAFQAEPISLQVVYEDEHIVVIDKPSNLVVHPGAGNRTGTLLNGLITLCPKNKSLPRAGIVHRLDKDTSGLLIAAKTLQAHTSLVEQLQKRSVTREYLALVYGTPPASGTIEKPIGRHPRNRKLMSTLTRGKQAITHFHTNEYGKEWALLRCNLETGRTHQIRVHLSSIDCPIIGDKTYVSTKFQRKRIVVTDTIARQALHATKLKIIHPVLNEPMCWEAPPPQDFQKTLEHLRAHY